MFDNEIFIFSISRCIVVVIGSKNVVNIRYTIQSWRKRIFSYNIFMEYLFIFFFISDKISCEIVWLIFAFADIKLTVFLLKFIKKIFIPFQFEILLFLLFIFSLNIAQKLSLCWRVDIKVLISFSLFHIWLRAYQRSYQNSCTI